ncbi:hypothetical protein HAX54_046999 [Datura stramonium]|uniref:Uncharacterized protein n=1 Tax=Datura stramonium TaxID=4076 RepID=A0ABS8RQ94_DATST|nr:hypothetical protein [Datura stramonium]
MKSSRPKLSHVSRPNSVNRGLVNQNGLGGFIEGGGRSSTKTSPRQAKIEKILAGLREAWDDCAEKRRELEYLEKGGHPLFYRHENSASLSVCSTSQECKKKKQKDADANDDET